MKILIATDHSKDIEELSALSFRNHWEYSATHAYDYLVIRQTWKEAIKNGYGTVIKLLDDYDLIMLIGVDVLFTNFNKKIEDIINEDDNVVLSKEPYGWAGKINNGVIILKNTKKTLEFLNCIQDSKPIWEKLDFLAQQWMNENYETDDKIKDALRIVETRDMNSTYKCSLSDWKTGDWIIHFYGHSYQNKIKKMKEFLLENQEIPR